MGSKQPEKILLVLLIFVLISINYSEINSFVTKTFSEKEKIFVEKVIDGDTISSDFGNIRLLGINSPEKGEEYYEESKNFLKQKIENRTVEIEFGKDEKDMYNRTLAYVFLENKNINAELIENGFANPYFPSGKTKYYVEFQLAWSKCLEQEKNLCKKSKDKCSQCVELKKIDVGNQEAVFFNNCDFSCNLDGWTIKDEGRKKFIFKNFNLNSKNEIIVKVGNGTNSKSKLYWLNKTYVWTKSGDSLFLRDKEGGLVLWKSY